MSGIRGLVCVGLAAGAALAGCGSSGSGTRVAVHRTTSVPTTITSHGGATAPVPDLPTQLPGELRRAGERVDRVTCPNPEPGVGDRLTCVLTAAGEQRPLLVRVTGSQPTRYLFTWHLRNYADMPATERDVERAARAHGLRVRVTCPPRRVAEVPGATWACTAVQSDGRHRDVHVRVTSVAGAHTKYHYDISAPR